MSCVEQSAIELIEDEPFWKHLIYPGQLQNCHILKKINRSVQPPAIFWRKTIGLFELPTIFWRKTIGLWDFLSFLEEKQSVCSTSCHILKKCRYLRYSGYIHVYAECHVNYVHYKSSCGKYQVTWKTYDGFFFSCDGEISKLIWLLKYCREKNDS